MAQVVIQPMQQSQVPGSCFVKVERELAGEHKPGAPLLKYDSQADLNQSVIGPTRHNRLSEKQADEIRSLTADLSKAFYELNRSSDKGFVSELLVIDRKSCKILKRFVLLDPAKDRR
jgi:hypothetical protein